MQRNKTADAVSRPLQNNKSNTTIPKGATVGQAGDDDEAQAYEGSQGTFPDNVSQYSASRSMAGNGNPNKLPGIPTGARPKMNAPNYGRNDTGGSASGRQGGQGSMPSGVLEGSSSFI
jgi:hypothetical protein